MFWRQCSSMSRPEVLVYELTPIKHPFLTPSIATQVLCGTPKNVICAARNA